MLAGTLGADASVYHVGFVVPDLEVAIETMSGVLGVPFTTPMALPFSTLQTPDGPRDGQVFGVDGGLNIPVMPSMAHIAEPVIGATCASTGRTWHES